MTRYVVQLMTMSAPKSHVTDQRTSQPTHMPVRPDPVPAFKIVHDIPLRKIITRTPSLQFPLADMKVGDSFYVANRGSKQQAQRERVRVQARRLKPKQFAIRTEGDGMRVWRVK